MALSAATPLSSLSTRRINQELNSHCFPKSVAKVKVAVISEIKKIVDETPPSDTFQVDLTAKFKAYFKSEDFLNFCGDTFNLFDKSNSTGQNQFKDEERATKIVQVFLHEASKLSKYQLLFTHQVRKTIKADNSPLLRAQTEDALKKAIHDLNEGSIIKDAKSATAEGRGKSAITPKEITLKAEVSAFNTLLSMFQVTQATSSDKSSFDSVTKVIGSNIINQLENTFSLYKIETAIDFSKAGTPEKFVKIVESSLILLLEEIRNFDQEQLYVAFGLMSESKDHDLEQIARDFPKLLIEKLTKQLTESILAHTFSGNDQLYKQKATQVINLMKEVMTSSEFSSEENKALKPALVELRKNLNVSGHALNTAASHVNVLLLDIAKASHNPSTVTFVDGHHQLDKDLAHFLHSPVIREIVKLNKSDLKVLENLNALSKLKDGASHQITYEKVFAQMKAAVGFDITGELSSIDTTRRITPDNAKTESILLALNETATDGAGKTLLELLSSGFNLSEKSSANDIKDYLVDMKNTISIPDREVNGITFASKLDTVIATLETNPEETKNSPDCNFVLRGTFLAFLNEKVLPALSNVIKTKATAKLDFVYKVNDRSLIPNGQLSIGSAKSPVTASDLDDLVKALMYGKLANGTASTAKFKALSLTNLKKFKENLKIHVAKIITDKDLLNKINKQLDTNFSNTNASLSDVIKNLTNIDPKIDKFLSEVKEHINLISNQKLLNVDSIEFQFSKEKGGKTGLEGLILDLKVIKQIAQIRANSLPILSTSEDPDISFALGLYKEVAIKYFSEEGASLSSHENAQVIKDILSKDTLPFRLISELETIIVPVDLESKFEMLSHSESSNIDMLPIIYDLKKPASGAETTEFVDTFVRILNDEFRLVSTGVIKSWLKYNKIQEKVITQFEEKLAQSRELSNVYTPGKMISFSDTDKSSSASSYSFKTSLSKHQATLPTGFQTAELSIESLFNKEEISTELEDNSFYTKYNKSGEGSHLKILSTSLFDTLNANNLVYQTLVHLQTNENNNAPAFSMDNQLALLKDLKQVPNLSSKLRADIDSRLSFFKLITEIKLPQEFAVQNKVELRGALKEQNYFKVWNLYRTKGTDDVKKTALLDLLKQKYETQREINPSSDETAESLSQWAMAIVTLIGDEKEPVVIIRENEALKEIHKERNKLSLSQFNIFLTNMIPVFNETFNAAKLSINSFDPNEELVCTFKKMEIAESLLSRENMALVNQKYPSLEDVSSETVQAKIEEYKRLIGIIGITDDTDSRLKQTSHGIKQRTTYSHAPISLDVTEAPYKTSYWGNSDLQASILDYNNSKTALTFIAILESFYIKQNSVLYADLLPSFIDSLSKILKSTLMNEVTSDELREILLLLNEISTEYKGEMKILKPLIDDISKQVHSQFLENDLKIESHSFSSLGEYYVELLSLKKLLDLNSVTTSKEYRDLNAKNTFLRNEILNDTTMKPLIENMLVASTKEDRVMLMGEIRAAYVRNGNHFLKESRMNAIIDLFTSLKFDPVEIQKTDLFFKRYITNGKPDLRLNTLVTNTELKSLVIKLNGGTSVTETSDAIAKLVKALLPKGEDKNVTLDWITAFTNLSEDYKATLIEAYKALPTA
jgi:hypothetical protein